MVGVVVAFVVPASPLHPHWYGNDASVYWWGARAFVDGGDVHAQQPGGAFFTYPRFAALVFVPLAGLSETAAQNVVVVLGAVATVAVVLLSIRAAGVRDKRVWSLGLIAAAPAMVLYVSVSGYVVGQIDALIVMLVLADMVRPESRRLPRGLLIGVAVALKVTPAIFIAALLVRGRVRAAVVAAVSAAVLLVVGAGFDVGRLWDYLFGSLADSTRVGPVSVLQNQSLAGAVARFNGGGVDSLEGGQRLAWAMACVLVLAVAALATRRWGEADQGVVGTAAAAIAGLLISPISWMHHWLWVIPTVALLVAEACRGRRMLPALLAVLGLAAASFGPQWFFAAVGPWSPWAFVGSNALVLWGLAVLSWTALAPPARPDQSPTMAASARAKSSRVSMSRPSAGSMTKRPIRPPSRFLSRS